MPTSLPQSVREHFGEQVADDFATWLDHNFEERTVHRDEYREVLSRLDVLEERFDHVDERLDRMEAHFEERFNQIDERFDQQTQLFDQRLDTINERFDAMNARMDERFDKMDGKLDQMNDRILSMTRWLIGLLVAFGTMVTVMLGIAQFTA